ncbi:MAG: complex I NDUFA9 subunit family protein [Rhizobiaceae bacterium]|nr:complex I NDUFA9 subunit family protein [Rhizobiaceae bacterium]
MKLSSTPELVTVFGGSGFVGRYVVRALVNRGYQVRVACRRPDLAGHLQPLGNVGQIHLMQANLRYPDSVAAAVKGASVVINLVGILAESGKQKFDAVQFYGAQAVAKAAKEARAKLVHMSAIGADAESESKYGETKGRAEEVVRKIIKSAIIIRPSIVFGQEDDFFNRFGAMTRLAPALPLIGGGVTRFQPVYVGDVAEAIARAVDGELAEGKIYELGGPEVKTFRECLQLLLKEVGRSKMFVNLPFFAASAIGKLIGWLPGAPITHDQAVMLKSDNVVSDEAMKAGRTLEGIGIKPTPMAAILPSYLVQYRPQGQFTDISKEEG